MSQEKIRDLLRQLRQELQSTDVDSSTQTLLHELDASLSGDAAHPATPATLTDRVRELEARFAAKHEGAEMLLRQVVDVLGKMGV